MKRVRLKSDEISADDLNDSHVIGVIYKSGKRAFVTKIHNDKYMNASIDHRRNMYAEMVTHPTVKHAVENPFVVEAFVFNRPKELYLWMAEGE